MSESALIAECPLCGSEGRFAYEGSDQLLRRGGTYRYLDCLSCGAVFLSPMPDAATISTFYPEEYLDHDQPPVAKPLGRVRQAVLTARYGYPLTGVSTMVRWLGHVVSRFMYRDEIAWRGGGKALDVGCGNGKFVQKLASLGWQSSGVEFSDSAAQAGRDAGLDIQTGELQSAAFAAQSFNLVSARHLIEHLPDPRGFMAEAYRVTAPGGRLVIRTPNSRALGRGWFGVNWYANDPPRHVVLYSAKNLGQLAEGAGFSTVFTRTFTSPKIILNSWDYQRGNLGKPSRKKKLWRVLARLYVVLASVTGRGDELFAVYEKQQ